MHVVNSSSSFTVVPFTSEYRDAFRALNLQWLVDNALYEAADDKQLDNPEEIIATGGEIYVALVDGNVAGTAALIPHNEQRVELAKVCVTPSAHGRGIGRALTEYCLGRARIRRYATVVLTTSSKLTAAIRLYESVGFQRVPVPEWSPYVTADVAMELLLP